MIYKITTNRVRDMKNFYIFAAGIFIEGNL